MVLVGPASDRIRSLNCQVSGLDWACCEWNLKLDFVGFTAMTSIPPNASTWEDRVKVDDFNCVFWAGKRGRRTTSWESFWHQHTFASAQNCSGCRLCQLWYAAETCCCDVDLRMIPAFLFMIHEPALQRCSRRRAVDSGVCRGLLACRPSCRMQQSIHYHIGLQQTSAYSGFTSCYKRCWATVPGIPLHLRQGVLLDHSGREGVSSRILFE